MPYRRDSPTVRTGGTVLPVPFAEIRKSLRRAENPELSQGRGQWRPGRVESF